MDLLEFSQCELYFEEPLPPEGEALLREAAQRYGEPHAESLLQRAYFLYPQNLMVLVGLYRYYFYQHRLEDTLVVADRSIALSGERLALKADWRHLSLAHMGEAATRSFGMLRFYLLALKAKAVVLLRLGRVEDSREVLLKLTELDEKDRLGAAKLLEVVDEFHPLEEDEPTLTSQYA